MAKPKRCSLFKSVLSTYTSSPSGIEVNIAGGFLLLGHLDVTHTVTMMTYIFFPCSLGQWRRLEIRAFGSKTFSNHGEACTCSLVLGAIGWIATPVSFVSDVLGQDPSKYQGEEGFKQAFLLTGSTM